MSTDHDHDLEQRLRTHLGTSGPLPAASEVAAAAGHIVRRRQVRARVLVGSVSALAVVGAGLALAARSDDSRVATVPTVDATAPPASDPPGTDAVQGPSSWTLLPADPRGTRIDAGVVWTGTEAIVVGGRGAQLETHGDAAAYDPSSGAWRVLPSPPVDGLPWTDPLVAWTGDRVIVLGGVDRAGSADVPPGLVYDPAADAWGVVAGPAASITSRSPWAWTGTELLVWPDDLGDPAAGDVPLAYDPVRDVWSALPEPPVQGRQQAASVWTGREWVVWGGVVTGGPQQAATALADGAAYDPSTGTWRALAVSPLSARRVRAVWTGSEMLVYAGSRGGDPITGDGELALDDGAAYDPLADTWRPMRPGLTHPGFRPVWTGSQLLMFAKGCVVGYDPATDMWGESACGGEGVPVWSGTEALLFGYQASAYSPT